MKETLSVINEMQSAGVIGKYAIGGAVAATFYLEPSATLDIGIFVALRNAPSGLLLSVSPVYEYLLARGYKTEGEYIIVEGWPIQFLPPGTPLEEEAFDEAIATDLDGVRICVMAAEHLVAIALNVGRAKDFARILQFVENGKLDIERLDSILRRHHLVGKWEQFGEKFLKIK